MPVVSRISIAPVKGLGLVHPEEVLLEMHGVRENRRFHIVDADGRRFNQLRNGALVQIRPEYDADTERLTLRGPDGSVADGEVSLGAEVTTDFYGRDVVGNYVEGPWSVALSGWAGSRFGVQSSRARGRPRSGHVSLISTASLCARPGRRQRAGGRRPSGCSSELDGCEPHERMAGPLFRIGGRDRIRGDVGRCAITTQNPETGTPDFDTLRTIATYRGFTENEAGQRHIPFGVYGEVTEPGRVTIGDAVEIVELIPLDQTT
jgi:uncharacterized protein YcbX